MITESFCRRSFLKGVSGGFGYLAMGGFPAAGMAASGPHFAPRAKRVIRLFMQGGPSHVDTFDYKPELIANDGKTVEATVFSGGLDKPVKGELMQPQWKFRQHGESGLWVSDVWRQLAAHADDLCLLNGMHTDVAAHPQATIMAHTGSIIFVRPSIGSWVLHGLGVENRNLPGFVAINPLNRLGGAQNYGSAFLPASLQATAIINNRIENLANTNLSASEQRKQLELLQSMNREALARVGGDAGMAGVMESFDLAFNMQDVAPEILDISKEPAAIQEMYGIGGPKRAAAGFGAQCLMARRLAEAGVRYIELTQTGWDNHRGLRKALQGRVDAIDQPIAGLIADLKQRGMLEETLIMWGGEFGRTPVAQDAKRDGRRHNNRGYSMWLCGGGVRGGMRHGATDPLGFEAVENKTHIHDLNATVLHLLGLDHEKLTYRYSGRDFRLTDVYGKVQKDIIA
ncbi:MAG: DUF1501 domain-containing protein [Planctomycetota bacterium]|nr:DUF1501 domain-containing protein [Planctomycetota bacterium]